MQSRLQSAVRFPAMVFIVFMLIGMAGCGGGSSNSKTQTAAPSITNFSVSPSTITTGNSAMLSWTVQNAASLSIDNGVGTVTGTSISVKPAQTTTYTLTATNQAQTSITAKVTVTVVPAPSITSFTASPTVLTPATTGITASALTWTVANTTTVSIDNGIGVVTGSSVNITPPATTTYTLTAQNAAGTTATATVTVGVRNNLAVLAGVPYPGADADGTGTSATFAYPEAVAVDGSGNLYVADTDNNEIRMVTPAGVVTTIASGEATTSGTASAQGGHARRENLSNGSPLRRSSLRNAPQGKRATARSANSLIKNAGLNDPEGIAVTSDGKTIYVADTGNDAIREIVIAADGTANISTFAGTLGVSGSADGTGTAASFFYPTGIALDAGGNLYVADTDNYTVRKITPAGVVSTLAGTPGAYGSADGTGSAAMFSYLRGIAVDVSGNVYVADTDNNDTIRKITPAGVVSTLAGTPGVYGSADGTGSGARFEFPEGIAVDTNGNLYVTDAGNDTIRKVTPAGVVSTLAGTPGTSGSTDGTGSEALFSWPAGIAVDTSGNLYVADTGNSTIRKIVISSDTVSTLAGNSSFNGGFADGTGSAAEFSDPAGVAVDANDNVYVADFGNDVIRKITPAGVVSTLAGTPGVYGSADGTGSAASFEYPVGIAVDGSGNLFVADYSGCTIRKITPAGVVSTLAGSAGNCGYSDGTGSAASFAYPVDVAVDTAGNLYVADAGNDVIRKITPAGVVSTLAGTPGTYGSADGTGSAASFNDPVGIAVDTNGNVYVADYGNDTIRKITPAGVVSTLAGSAGNCGHSDGTGNAAGFCQPADVTVDGNGNLFVADNFSLIRRVTPAGVVTTIIGTYGNATASTGPLPASLYQPLSLAVDSSDNLFITVPNAVLTLEP